MKRTPFLLGFTLLACLVYPAVASADAKDVAAGTATIVGFLNPTVHLNAQSEPSLTGPGLNARGHFFVKYPPPEDLEVRGDITCLNVAGNAAVAGGVITHVSGTVPPIAAGTVVGAQVEIRALDMGSPGTLDGSNWGPTAAVCANPTGTLPVSDGNYVVHDATSLGVLSNLDVLLAEIEAASPGCGGLAAKVA